MYLQKSKFGYLECDPEKKKVYLLSFTLEENIITPHRVKEIKTYGGDPTYSYGFTYGDHYEALIDMRENDTEKLNFENSVFLQFVEYKDIEFVLEVETPKPVEGKKITFSYNEWRMLDCTKELVVRINGELRHAHYVRMYHDIFTDEPIFEIGEPVV